MLRDQSVGAVFTLAKKLTDANVVVRPVPETPLAILNNACYSPMLEAAQLNDLDESAVMYRLQDVTRQADLSGKVPHDVAMEDIVAVVAKTVQSNLHLAKNVVNPIIKSVVESVENDVKAADIKMVNLLSVVPDTYRNIWNSPVLEGMVDRYSDTSIADQPVEHRLPTLDSQTLMGIILTGAGRFDSEIVDWAKDLPEGYLIDVYNSFFNRANQGQFGKERFNDFFGGNGDRDAILAIHLMARRLEKNIPDDVDMDVGQYRTYMTDVIAQSGRAVIRILEKRAKDAKSKNLIKNWPVSLPENLGARDEIILVNGDIYNDWLEAGGCPEILFGAYLLDRNGDTAKLIERGAEYKAAWARQANLLRTRASAQRFSVTLSALRRAISKQVNEMAEDVLPVANRASLHERLTERMEGLSERDLEDLFGLARRLVCGVMYAHTDAERILLAIDAVGRANPEMDIREVALLATIDHVAGWVAKLMRVEVQTHNL